MPPLDLWKQAARQSDHTVMLPGKVPMFFRRIPLIGDSPGSFLMGSRGKRADEEPRHRVIIAREFFLGTFVVTQEQWRGGARKCAALKERAEPSDESQKGTRRPVDSVDWHEAMTFCEWLTQSGLLPAGFTACLPSEAQWEYACRAGSETEYYNGDGEAALAEVAWYAENSGSQTHPVDEKAEAHPFGVFGMHGNVWEWCRDAWDKDAYKKRADGAAEPLTSPEAENPPRVLRGGSWIFAARFCRSAVRLRYVPVDRFGYVGFRVCLVPGPPDQPERGAPQTEPAQPASGAGGRGTSPQAKRAGGADVDLAREKMPPA